MRIGVLLFLLLSSSWHLLAQHFSFIQYNTSSGLPQSQVTSITQDSAGYLWIGTYGGLAQFDGTNFNKFGRNNGLLNNRITSLEYIENKLYIGHAQGVSVQINDDTFESISHSDEGTLGSVTGFAKIDSTLYVSTNGAGLFVLNQNEKKLIPIENSPDRIREIALIDQKLFLATREGIVTYNGEHFITIQGSENISFSGLLYDKGVLFATSFTGTLYRINMNKKEKEVEVVFTDEFHVFRDITIDKYENKWLHSSDGIVYIKDDDTLEITEQSGLATNDVDVIFEDSEENIWIGTNGKGLLRFTNEVFTYYNEKSGFPSDLVIAMEMDKRNNTWFSSIDQGVWQIDGKGEFHKIDFIPSVVWQIVSSKDLVIFASDYGLFTYDYTTFKSYYKENLLPSNRIIGIHPLSDSTYLISTSNGGIIFNSQTQMLVPKKTALTSLKNVRMIKKKGEITYAISNNTVYLIQGEKIKQHRFDSDINCIETDSQGQIWLGTENGLVFEKDNHFYNYYLEKESEIEYINFIQRHDSSLYVGTNNGLYEINTYLNERIHYGINYGLIDLETNFNSNFLEKNRYLWFGTASGLIKMDLKMKRSLLTKAIPRLYLKEITINNNIVEKKYVHAFNHEKETSPLTVKYQDKNITFSFDGIYMSNPESIRYTYFIEGFSDTWSTQSRHTDVNLTNLPPGKYTLHFKASSGTQNSKTFYISFQVLPPFYLTWWFYTIIGLLILFSFLYIERARTKRLQQKNYQMKLEFQNKLTKLEQQSLNANMNRHFIFNSLNSIQYYVNASDTKSANKYLSRFAKLIRKNLDSSYNEDGMVTLADELERLELYLELECMRFIGKFDYSFAIEEHIETETLMVPAMFLQPFVENSIIHGVLPLKNKKGKIDIIITDHLNFVKIKIQDNGVGITQSLSEKRDKEAFHQPHGMMITKKRIELLQKFSEVSISMDGPHQINENNSLINGTVVTFKILKQYLE